MSDDLVRTEWRLRVMYGCTIVVAGSFGLGNLLAPAWAEKTFSLPPQDPIVFSTAASVYLAFAVLSALGMRAPLKFAPVLLLQLVYKAIWLVGGALPMLVAGTYPDYALLNLGIFIAFIVGDLWALPFGHLFKRAGVAQEKVDAVGMSPRG